MNSREKGLKNVREVRKLLEGMGCTVDGPGYGVAFFNGRMSPIHKDFFSIADLIAWHPEESRFILHQVTDLTNKAVHVKDIIKQGLPCWLWCRWSDGVNKAGYRVFHVLQSGSVVESEVRWGIR